MIYNYDPILGLQYQSIDCLPLRLDMNTVPTDFDMKKFIEEFREWSSKAGVQFIDSSKPKIEELNPIIYHNLFAY